MDMDDDDQYIITQIHEKREEFFKIRFIPEIEYESGVWVKLNNANPLRSNTANMFAYVEIIRLLQPLAKSIMYGEPCSTVPIYKKNK